MRTFSLIFFTLNLLTAQKVVKKSIVDSAISSFQIDASNCFKINFKTDNTNEIVVVATIDGEYEKDLVLNVTDDGTTVQVSAGFRPDFENPNDKLSAHKVVSISLEINLPANKNVRVFGTNTNVTATGAYEYLKITLNDGASQLYKVKGIAEISSQSGDIIVKSKAAEIESNSKYGKVEKNQIPLGNTKFILNTVTGNIRFMRIE